VKRGLDGIVLYHNNLKFLRKFKGRGEFCKTLRFQKD